ncbi:MAG: peptidase M22 [Eubacteriales bacterium]
MNSNKGYYLGLDTSNYTTSAAIVDQAGNIIRDERKVLSIRPGERGLRQSEALFQHINNLPDIFETLVKDLDRSLIHGISSSDKPRNIPGSYMPVFNAGSSFAKVVSSALGIPYSAFSHQDGHLQSALYQSDLNPKKEFIAFHISGGTSEILKVEGYTNLGFRSNLIGGTKDISYGQLIDRIGVLMGFPFPCGRHMEVFIENKMAEKSTGNYYSNDFIKIHLIKDIHIENNHVNLSGVENTFQKLISNLQIDRVDILMCLFNLISKALIQQIYQSVHISKYNNLLLTGGVFSNKLIRKTIVENKIDNCNIIFGQTHLCSDNAVGIALLCLEEIKYYSR